MIEFHPFRKLTILLLLLGGLAACDSGTVGTSGNPNLGTSNEFVYTGSAARNIDVSNFQFYLWRNLIDTTRCGGCHNSQAASPNAFYFFDTTDVNLAYDQVMTDQTNSPYVDLANPPASRLVTKVNGGHNCWESVASVCGTLIADWIADWANANNGGLAARPINLVIPENIRDPGDAKSFPDTATTVGTNGRSFANTVHPLLVGSTPPIANDNCQACHEEIATPLPQAPFFASGDVDSAFEAAKSKMDIDTPANSRFVARLNEGHNCWSDCPSDALAMRTAIELFAAGIEETPVDEDLVTSKALTLDEGIVATGGNRHETDQFALWEFKTGTGTTAFDTSGLDPAINLSFEGSVNWVGGYGLEFSNGGRAQANPISSDKLFTYIQDTGAYAIEAWVIPGNVSQEDANIISYSGNDNNRNFTLSQTLYNYESYNRINTIPPAPNGDPFLTTADSGMEIAQATLQHVVVNYDPFTGREIYVNGELITPLTDPAAGENVSNVWDDTFTLVFGNETTGNRSWSGIVKMAAIHNRTLTPAQIQQNFDVGVGQKFFLLFYVGHHLGEAAPDPNDPNPQDASFIMFEVAQFDSYSYLFNEPTFINLNPAWTPPGDIDIQGLRIGINGKEASAGQAFASLNATVSSGSYSTTDGQLLSSLGTIIALEKGPGSDEFFLSFEMLGSATNAFTEATPSVPDDPPPSADIASSDIGVRTFEEINNTIAEITGVPIDNPEVLQLYNDYVQQLPAVEAIDAFLPSHQMAVAQLALTSCSELVDNTTARAAYFPLFNFGIGSPGSVDDPAERQAIIGPILTAVANSPLGLTSQPSDGDLSNILGATTTQTLEAGLPNPNYESLITQLSATCPPIPPATTCDPVERTAQIVKAVCAAATGAAVMIVQ